MEANSQDIIETQKKRWNHVAPAWKKWDKRLDQNFSFINYRLTADARIRPGHRVLDLGCGTGNPTLLLARAVGQSGEVIGLDLAAEMLSVARQRAKQEKISNITFHQSDITTLSYGNDEFDAVTSRFCLMFLPDIPKALAEIARVLRPHGFLAVAVWSDPQKNPYMQIPLAVLGKYVELPQPLPEEPGPFRLASPGSLLQMVRDAGLEAISDDELLAESLFDSADEHLENLKDLAATLKPLFEKLSPQEREATELEIKQTVNQYRRGDEIAIPMAIRIVVARKPA